MRRDVIQGALLASWYQARPCGEIRQVSCELLGPQFWASGPVPRGHEGRQPWFGHRRTHGACPWSLNRTSRAQRFLSCPWYWGEGSSWESGYFVEGVPELPSTLPARAELGSTGPPYQPLRTLTADAVLTQHER